MMFLGFLFGAMCLGLVCGQYSQCQKPVGEVGEYLPINSCPHLKKILDKPNKSAEDIALLKKLHCGFVGNMPQVWCAKQGGSEAGACITPDGKPGTCINVYSCPQISNLLKPPVSAQNMAFVRNSACRGPHKFNVCCGTSPASSDGDYLDSRTRDENKACRPHMTAYPPSPSTGCCGSSAEVGNKIVGAGGEATAIDQYPWTALIEYETKQELLLCGGVLISGRYVLTAAHCIAGVTLKNGTPKFIRLGEYNITNEGRDCKLSDGGGQDCTEGVTRIEIERTIPHPEYNPIKTARWNDIGLIRLKEVAPYTDFIRPVCLPTKDITLSRNRDAFFTMFVTGWGATENKKFSDVKLEVEVPFVPLEQCQPAYSSGIHPSRKLWKGQLCAGGRNGTDSCKGDSGGPLMYENNKLFELAGVVSFGKDPCGIKGVPGVYSNIYEYRDWIRSVIVP
ncbi:unnamed protein product [Spodoptera littoralis]|uniref:CLIP domain-containing serine protease n=1 Tax=Spodoptera littoralis TaxID=7109 RepID=A0A9P0I829_SPOLI|nr:unnamed protein product [Spodoptera littoralis]CAH1641727.1 unnamed protein product [Spodoptera littoralis]